MTASEKCGRSGGPAPELSVPHGFSDDRETRRLLRSRPPRPPLAWAERVTGAKVVATRSLRGGTSSAVHLLLLRTKGGALDRAVLRRYVRPDVNLEEPGIVEHEVNALHAAEGADVPTPRLIGADKTGMEAGVPAVLMSFLPGRVEWSPKDLDRWLHRLAELLPKVHAVDLPADGAYALPPFVPYSQETYEPPAWARWPKVWEKAVEIFHGPPLPHPPVFIQRDFHPGNVLWRRGVVSGVIDWQAGCVGPAVADVAHCRANLFRYGLEVADRFGSFWEQLSGQRYDPRAEIFGILGFLDVLRSDPGRDAYTTEEALARAVKETTGAGRR